MAVIPTVRLHNIVSITQGVNTYEGIRSVNIDINKGRLAPILKEGVKYVTGAENLGIPDFPVRTATQFEGGVIPDGLLAEPVGNLVIVYKADGATVNQTCTISNHQFETDSQSQGLQQFGNISARGSAYSSDGSALPIAFT